MLFASFKSTFLAAACALAVAAPAVEPVKDVARVAGELGRPLVQQFPVRAYKGPNMTWNAVQDRAGVLYVGSVSCVLGYDGLRWTTIPTGGDAVRSVAVDAEDRIWIGGVNELGYLAADSRGVRTYVSLKDRLPAPVRRYGDCYAVIALPHGVYFVTTQHWLRWHDGEFTWGPLGTAGRNAFYANRGFASGGELVVHSRGEPLRAFDGERWRVVSAAPELLAPGGHVVLISALPDAAWLLGTAADGFWQLKEGRLTRWSIPADPILRQHPISEACRLPDGSFALARHPHDVLVLDAAGQLLTRLDADHGLQSSVCLSPFADRHGDLWLMLDAGLARVTWPMHLSLFDRANGLGRGFIRDIARHDGRLYVATRNTLCVLRPTDTATGTPATFDAVPGFADVWRLESTARGLLVTCANEIRFLRSDGTTELVATGGTYRAAIALGSTADQVLLNTTVRTLLVRRVADGWSVPESLVDLAGEPRVLKVDRDGSVWTNALDAGLYRFVGLPGTASADGQPPRVEHYPGGHGLPSEQLPERPPLAATGDGAVFLDQNRLFRFDPAARRFVEFAQLPAELRAVGAEASGLTDGAADALWVRTTRRDPLAGPWQGRQRWRRAADGAWAAASFAGLELAGEKPAVFEEPAASGTVLWIGGSDALARVELPAEFVRPTPEFVTRVQRAESASGALPLAGAVELPYAQRRLTLTFATDRLDGEHLRFETQLDDDAWSPPSERAEWSAAFLPIGRHELRVRARDADGRVSAPARFAFTVLPPWWLTWWAIVSALALAGAAVSALILWRLRRLRRRNLELEQTVAARTSELRSRKQELSSALDAAVSANRAKSVFLAHMSHELRTPLNAILGFAQILQRDRGLNAEQQRRLGIIGRNGEHLLQMINEVLDLSKIEAGHVAAVPRPTDLRPLLEGIADNFAQRAADKGLAFDRELAADLPASVDVDATKLRQVLVNLLGNAVKFTAAGRVGLRVRRVAPGASRVRFECTDTGPGLDAAEQAALFTPFSQGAAGRASPQPGTGLGLAISQRLVGAMGGQITIATAPGRGSCFAFELDLPPTGHDPQPRPSAPLIAGYAGTRRRLLVVDDEASNREVLRALLAPLGFEIEECADGRACLDAFRRQPADAVLLDLRMPGELDGYATARALRTLPGGESPALVAVSASVFEEDRQTALDAGCDTFVPKPFSEERLLHALAECLDLTWVLQPAPTAPSPLGVLPAKDAELLRTLARRGDMQAFRDHLKRLAARPECAAVAAHLDALAAGFQLGRLRQELRALSDTPPLS